MGNTSAVRRLGEIVDLLQMSEHLVRHAATAADNSAPFPWRGLEITLREARKTLAETAAEIDGYSSVRDGVASRERAEIASEVQHPPASAKVGATLAGRIRRAPEISGRVREINTISDGANNVGDLEEFSGTGPYSGARDGAPEA